MKDFSDKELAFRLRTRPSFAVCEQAAARIDSLTLENARKMAAIEQFEAWWQEVGQVSFNGAPACVFALREAAAKARGGA